MFFFYTTNSIWGLKREIPGFRKTVVAVVVVKNVYWISSQTMEDDL